MRIQETNDANFICSPHYSITVMMSKTAYVTGKEYGTLNPRDIFFPILTSNEFIYDG